MKVDTMLEIKNLHAAVDGKQILKGIDLTIQAARSMPSWVRTAPARARSPRSWPGARAMRSRRDRRLRRPATCSRWRRRSAPREGVFLAFQYPVEIPGVTAPTFLKTALNEIRKRARRAELDAMQFLESW